MGADRITLRNGVYYYVRRVPQHVQHLDTRGAIRQSLKTRSANEAAAAAAALDRANETLWASLLLGDEAQTSWQRYDAAVSVAKTLGFQYWPADQLRHLPKRELTARMTAVADTGLQASVVEAVVGGVPEPEVTLDTLADVYMEKNKAALVGKSPAQRNKHEQQRRASLLVARTILGPKALKDVTLIDTQKYRQHWVDRVAKGEVTRESANRSMSDVKGMISVIDRSFQTSHGAVWTNIRILGKRQSKNRRKRPPYPKEWVQNVLLATGNLDTLNTDARLILYIMVETGTGPSEVCNLRPEDIVLNHKIPHISVSERDDREQKTAYRIRTIPLVGVSLWAARQAPNGFPKYHDKGAVVSTTINKYLRENDLQPTEKHSLYSLRHTFQDRILAANVPDRVQVDLMGHELGRPEYGEGATLEQKLEVLEKVKFRWVG